MILKRVEKTCQQNTVRVSAWVDSPKIGNDREIWFEFSAEFEPLVSNHADAFLPLLQIPSCVYGEELEFIPPLSEQLYHHHKIPMSIQTTWFPELHSIQVNAHNLVRRSRPQEQENTTPLVGTFFSAGVDSFYTLIKNHQQENHSPYNPKITHLIMMQGYENPLKIDEAGAFKQELLARTAKDFGLAGIHGKSNFRDVFEDVKWGPYYHGAGLAAAALLLSQGLSSVYVPASCHWNNLFPWGSHPLLDPAWESEILSLIHDGCEASRMEKTRFCAEQDIRFLSSLYVCVGKGKNNVNCGGCNKCIRTETTLEILGLLNNAKTFEKTFYPGFEKKFTRKTLRKHQHLIQAELDFALENWALSEELNHPNANMKAFLVYFIRRAKWALLKHKILTLLKSSG
ncbi:MAG: hypothetical protein ACFCU1_07185 [Sumerlaeia bacterium]